MIILVPLFSLAAIIECRKVVKETGSCDISSVLSKLPQLKWVTPLLIGLGSIGLLISVVPELYWSLPVGLVRLRAILFWVPMLMIGSYLFTLYIYLIYLSGHKYRWLLVVVFMSLMAFIYIKQAAATPVAPRLSYKRNCEGVILQTSEVSCSPASAANVATVLGMHVTEAQMADLFNTTLEYGTDPIDIVWGLEQLGFVCRRAYLKQANPQNLPGPAIISIKQPYQGGYIGHSVALIGWNGEQPEIWDPLVGKINLTTEKLDQIWNGQVILVDLKSHTTADTTAH